MARRAKKREPPAEALAEAPPLDASGERDLAAGVGSAGVHSGAADVVAAAAAIIERGDGAWYTMAWPTWCPCKPAIGVAALEASMPALAGPLGFHQLTDLWRRGAAP